MREGLAIDIALYLADRPDGETASEIALGLRARRFDVALTLRDDERFYGPVKVGAAPHAKEVWSLAAGTAGQAGTGKKSRWPGRSTRFLAPGSQHVRVLEVLSDGRWHTSSELYRRVHCVLHSRIYQLREMGYDIPHRGGGPGAEAHEYRLASRPGENTMAAAA